MTIILNSRIRRYVAIVGIFLIITALLAVMAGCGFNGSEFYTLTISSTEGGSVTTPGEGTFTYDAGTVVDLVVEAEDGYGLTWTGDVDSIASIHSLSTDITMYGDYSIIATFVEIQGIQDWYDLHAIRDNLSGHYAVMNDLDSTTLGYEELANLTANGGKGWQPIGTLGVPFDSFTGSFNGQDYEIRDLFINRPDEQYVGLFGVVDGVGCIEDIGVVNANVTAYQAVGGLVGENAGTVSNSYYSGSVTGESVVGGLVGENTGTVNNCYSSGNMTVTGEHQGGGLVGVNCRAVSNSYSTSTVTGDSGVGGLVGFNEFDSTVSNSYSTGSVTGSEHVGGLMGTNWLGTVTNSYSTGSVTGNERVGGLVGFNPGTVTNSYSTGNVTGNEDVGGLVGANHCVDGSCGIVTNSFWDTETSGQSSSDGGTGKTTAQMKNIATFSGAGWNIIAVMDSGVRNVSYIWNIVDNETYPFLSWQP